MSATMARQGGRVQQEQSDMRLALNMAKMAKEGFSHAAIEETKKLIKIPHTKVQEEEKWGVEFPGHEEVKTGVQRHPAMLHQNHTSRCLPNQNSTARNPQTHRRRTGIGAPPPNWRSQLTPELRPHLPSTPPAPTGNNSGTQCSHIVNLPARYACSHTSLPCAEFFNLDASAQDSQHDTVFGIQIRWLMKEHPLVTSLSDVW